MRIFYFLVVAAIASSSSFIVHIISAEWLPSWVATQMQGMSIQPSWSVRYVALITSIEYGLGATVLYMLAREKLIIFGRMKATIIFSVLLMAIHGAFVRQPLMDFLIGNPIHVVVVQNGFKWLVWLLMSLIVIVGYESVNRFKYKANVGV
ncbi:hypothetical protein [Vibrio spartinae]|uniref:Uncharacterized protein n=1 Tax=Vibrio spartinae TaxID=1918945 RepID=A0A1N6MBC7_9VIBR|nr:hypothetical protein [Vibrio spartinae]SIO96741.1 hypothetical protein VSP9026_04554 [Vibrio spartinae]